MKNVKKLILLMMILALVISSMPLSTSAATEGFAVSAYFDSASELSAYNYHEYHESEYNDALSAGMSADEINTPFWWGNVTCLLGKVSFYDQDIYEFYVNTEGVIELAGCWTGDCYGLDFEKYMSLSLINSKGIVIDSVNALYAGDETEFVTLKRKISAGKYYIMITTPFEESKINSNYLRNEPYYIGMNFVP